MNMLQCMDANLVRMSEAEGQLQQADKAWVAEWAGCSCPASHAVCNWQVLRPQSCATGPGQREHGGSGPQHCCSCGRGVLLVQLGGDGACY